MRSDDTVARYLRSYKPFQLFLSRSIKLREMKRRHIVRFRGWRLESCKEASVNTDLRHLKAFFNWCHGLEYFQRSPLVGIKISTAVKPVRFLTVDEEGALFGVIEDNQKAQDLMTFYLHSGARASELLPPGFKWTNVLQNEIVPVGKRNKIRHVGLNDTMMAILESRKQLPAPFPYSYGGVYQIIVRKDFRIAGILQADLNTLRKTAGARLCCRFASAWRRATATSRSRRNLIRHYRPSGIRHPDYPR